MTKRRFSGITIWRTSPAAAANGGWRAAEARTIGEHGMALFLLLIIVAINSGALVYFSRQGWLR